MWQSHTTQDSLANEAGPLTVLLLHRHMSAIMPMASFVVASIDGGGKVHISAHTDLQYHSTLNKYCHLTDI